MPWLADLPAACRANGLTVVEYAGWETRCNSRGPLRSIKGVIVHHTASNWSTSKDVEYMCHGAQYRPIANLYLGRDGVVTVMAAGSTNHAGGGGPNGPIGVDCANADTIGIEAANDGIGQPWTPEQIDAYPRLVAALCAHYDIDTVNVFAHHEYARSSSPSTSGNVKIDPAGPKGSMWASTRPGSPSTGGGSYMWDMVLFRSSVEAVTGSTPPPSTPVPPSSDLGAFPLASYHWFGPNDGTERSHSGIQSQDRPNIVKVQQRLMDLGYPLPRYGADGSYGGETKDAVLNFQRAGGLAVDGLTGGETWGAL